jgi:hypothetical protein
MMRPCFISALATSKPKFSRAGIATSCVATALLLVIAPALALAARSPTVAERASIQQALFDDIRTYGKPAHPVITRISVSKVRLGRVAGRRYYVKFARVDLRDPQAGYAAALLGYYVASIPGWRVLDLGSSEVGCKVAPKVFREQKRAVMRDLQLRCP